MTVEIPLEYQSFITGAIACGELEAEHKVVAEALRILEEQRRTTEYLPHPEMQVGLDELDRGEYVEFDEVSFKEFSASKPRWKDGRIWQIRQRLHEQEGVPTADDKALDADAILSA